MDEKRTKEAGMGEEDQSSKQGQTGDTYKPGQGGQGGSTYKPGQNDPGIQPGRGASQGNDWNKEPDKGTPESES
jgi:hypothetical protein